MIVRFVLDTTLSHLAITTESARVSVPALKKRNLRLREVELLDGTHTVTKHWPRKLSHLGLIPDLDHYVVT